MILVTYQSLLLGLAYRQKVDLTKYIEEHDFNFDNCFDSDIDNQ